MVLEWRAMPNDHSHRTLESAVRKGKHEQEPYQNSLKQQPRALLQAKYIFWQWGQRRWCSRTKFELDGRNCPAVVAYSTCNIEGIEADGDWGTSKAYYTTR